MCHSFPGGKRGCLPVAGAQLLFQILHLLVKPVDLLSQTLVFFLHSTAAGPQTRLPGGVTFSEKLSSPEHMAWCAACGFLRQAERRREECCENPNQSDRHGGSTFSIQAGSIVTATDRCSSVTDTTSFARPFECSTLPSTPRSGPSVSRTFCPDSK
jgi:hypothetical protein